MLSGPKPDLLPAGHMTPLCGKLCGQREFAVIGPDGDLVGFGSAIPAKA